MPSCAIYVDADITRMGQVFSNILNNAAQYTESGGKIHLTGQQQDGKVIVSVKDKKRLCNAIVTPVVRKMNGYVHWERPGPQRGQVL